MKSITVFTPTYNRAYCLHQCYESLINQTNSDFLWLIIDDGSTDDTRKLVSDWIDQGKVDIKYRYKKNGGMHSAHNAAYDLVETELSVCIDSDDFMPADAIDKILKKWGKVTNKHEVAGIIGLDSFKNGKIIGSRFPEGLNESTLEDLYYKYKIKGDKKLVLRTEVVNQYERYPTFEGERFVPLGTLYLQIDKAYKLICLNEVLCIVEYMEDGSSRNILKQYLRHPNGFQFARLNAMKFYSYPKIRFKNAIHYVSHSIQLRDYSFLKKSPKKLMTLAALPFGIALYCYVKYIVKK